MQSTLGVRSIIVQNNTVLMVEHKEKDFGQFYIFPGGGVEFGESIMDAAEREVKEETQLDVKAQKIIYIRETQIGENRGVEFYVLCDVLGGKLALGNDPEKTQAVLESVHFIPLEDLNTQKWYPEELKDVFFEDIKKGFQEMRYLGVSKLGD